MASNREGYVIINLPSLKNEKVVCLTLDVEQDYGDLLEEPSYEGLEHIVELTDFLKGRGIPLTCFVQGSILETHPNEVERLFALDIEFELHSYSHPGPWQMDTEFEVAKGKEVYREFFGRDPIGYRSPLGVIERKDYEILASNYFRFDSSVFPSLRPGTFNNLRKPTRPYLIDNPKIVEFPFAVFSDIIRVPIALSYIRLLGKPYLYLLKTFHLPNLVVFDFHLHDLFELSSSDKIPLEKFSFIHNRIFRKIYQGGQTTGLHILDELIGVLQKRGYKFMKLIDVYEAIHTEEPR